MKYSVVTESDESYFEDMVNAKLDAGWDLYGNPVVTYCGMEEDGGRVYQYTQAFTRQASSADDAL